MRRLGALGLGVVLLAAILPSPAAARGAGDPGLVWRGIVEGSYGRPWSHADRLEMLDWMGRHGFNAYVHAPKDDLYQRTNWRTPYPEAEQREFDDEIRIARRDGVDWIPSLSPALPLIPTPSPPAGAPSRDLCFSCPADLDAVVAKFRPFLDAGSRAVMVSFDDVAKVLTHPEDLVRYGPGDRGFGSANGDFLSRLQRRLAEAYPGVRVLTVGADYSGTADTPYLDGLRSTLDPGIEVMWTGTGQPSEQWTPADASSYATAIGRTPVVWENWTNDDTAGNATPFGTTRIFLGPYTRSSADAAAVRGFFFNPANEAALNELPLATAADWMADPSSYQPRASWLEAIRELAPGGSPNASARRNSLRAWAETSWSNKLDREREAPTFVRLSTAYLGGYADGRWPGPLRGLLRELRLVQLAPARLPGLPSPEIAREGGPFIDSAARMAGTGATAASLLAAERPALAVRRAPGGFAGSAAPPDPSRASRLRLALTAASASGIADRHFTYGWRTPFAFEVPPYPVPGNVMDAFVDRVRQLDLAWLPSSPRAASSVTVTLDGASVPLDSSGGFSLPAAACGGTLLATDGAGGRTVRRLPTC